MAKRPFSDQHRAAIAEGQRRSWRENPAARLGVKRERQSALQKVHARLAALPPPTVEQQERIHARVLKYLPPQDRTCITWTTESPPPPKLRGLQKILCGRLA
jgi:hypothetical protein